MKLVLTSSDKIQTRVNQLKLNENILILIIILKHTNVI